LKEALESDAFGDGRSAAVLIEKEADERELEEVSKLGQPVYDFDPGRTEVQ